MLQANLKQSRADTDTEQITGRKNTSSEERERTRKRAAALPDGWEPELADRAWQKDKGIPASYAADELEKFRDHWRAKGELRADWSATWRNWLRRALEYNPPPAQQRPSDWKFG